MTVTIAKLYDTYDLACDVVRDLEAAGLPSRDISLIASEGHGKIRSVKEDGSQRRGTGATAGAVLGGGAGLLAGLRHVGDSWSGARCCAGWLASLAAGAAAGAGAGGLIGALTDHGVDKDQADIYAEGIRRGGTLVSVRTSDARELEVERIMAAHTFRRSDCGAEKAIARRMAWV